MADNKSRALRAPEAIYNDLMKSPGDVVVDASEALAIWNIFRKAL